MIEVETALSVRFTFMFSKTNLKRPCQRIFADASLI